MNEEMQNQVLEWLKKGGEFVEREAPLLAQEIVSWYYWYSLLTAIGCAVVATIAIAVFFIALKSTIKRRDCEWELPCMLFGGLVGLVMTAFALDAASHAVKAVVAPRVVVVESISGILK